jgi:hypothetical protein
MPFWPQGLFGQKVCLAFQDLGGLALLGVKQPPKVRCVHRLTVGRHVGWPFETRQLRPLDD